MPGFRPRVMDPVGAVEVRLRVWPFARAYGSVRYHVPKLHLHGFGVWD